MSEFSRMVWIFASIILVVIYVLGAIYAMGLVKKQDALENQLVLIRSREEEAARQNALLKSTAAALQRQIADESDILVVKKAELDALQIEQQKKLEQATEEKRIEEEKAIQLAAEIARLEEQRRLEELQAKAAQDALIAASRLRTRAS